MLNHPHVVTVHDFGRTPAGGEGERRAERRSRLRAEKGTVPICAKHPKGRSGKWGLSPFPPDAGLFYFIMEFVDGVNLRRLLDTQKLAPEQALAIVPQICDALQYAHSAAWSIATSSRKTSCWIRMAR